MPKFMRWLWYPWLFAIYPAIYLYSLNIHFVNSSQVYLVVGFALVMQTALLGIFYLITKDIYVSAVMSTLAFMLFSLSGHISNLIIAWWPASQPLLHVRYLLPIYIFFLGLMTALLVRTKATGKLQTITLYLNVVAATLVIFNLILIIRYHSIIGLASLTYETDGERAAVEIVNNDAAHPDIYYIILDGYSSNQHLLQNYGFDNSAFTNELEARDFYVAYDSLANYGSTLASLPSSLNMRYISTDDIVSNLDGVLNMRHLLADNLVAQELQTHGYQYIFMLSGFSLPSTTADINIEFWHSGPQYYESVEDIPDSVFNPERALEPFLPLWIETTLLRGALTDSLFLDRVQKLAGGGLAWSSPQRALAVYNEAEKIPEMAEATFTFVHIIKPHNPVVFDRYGNILPQPQAEDDPDLFFEQLHFINNRTLSMLDRLIADSSVPPIIILQADHGSDLGEVSTPQDDSTHFGILNAYYFPEGRNDYLTQDITPVNSFRVMFNTFFDTDYELLENRHFDLPDGYGSLMQMREVDIEEWQAAQ